MERLAGNSRLVERGVVRRALTLLALGGAGALIVATGIPLCPMAGVLGVPCPGCGLTRATLAVLRGDIPAALHFHPLVFVIAPVFIWVVASAAFGYVRGARPRPNLKPWLATRTATMLASILLAATIAVWLARFAGYLGGPAPVETFHHWVLSLRHSAPHTRRTPCSPFFRADARAKGTGRLHGNHTKNPIRAADHGFRKQSGANAT